MSLLERVIVAHKCRSMHHYIVMDALTRLSGEDAEAWKSMLVFHHPELLKGAKAPDAEFKDFKNHVLHVGEGEWGGARDAATDWYARSVEALAAKKWSKAAYSLGVLSHYYADPCQPFHTGQTEEEGAIHRAVEWSIAKSRDRIKARIEESGYPDVPAGDGAGFVSDMVLAGATKAHKYYDTFIDHYDLHAGMDNPPTGIDETMFEAVVEMVAYATSGVATIISRAVAEAAVAPPKVSLTLPGYLAATDVPIRLLSKKIADATDRHQIEIMYAELQRTGKVVKTLPDDDKAIRKMHARQVLRTPLKELDAQPLKELGTKHVAWPVPDEDAVPVAESKNAEKASEKTDANEAADGQAKAAPAKLTRAERKAAKQAEADRKRAEKADAKAKAAAEKQAAIDAKAAERKTADEEKAAERKAAEDAKLKAAAAAKAAKDAAKAEKDAAKAEKYKKAKASDAPAETPKVIAVPESKAKEAKPASKPAPEPEIVTETAPEPDAATTEAADTAPRDGRLTRGAPIVAAPSIGRKTARRLSKAGLTTIADLMDADPDETAEFLDIHYITRETLIDWQDQTRLMMDVPGLRVHDAQILVGSGVRCSEDLAAASARDLFMDAMTFLTTEDGEHVATNVENLEEEEVEHWIDLARGKAA